MGRWWIPLAAVLATACPDEREAEVPAPAAPRAIAVKTSTASPWTLTRRGPRPVLAHGPSGLRLYVHGGPRHPDTGLPGAALGTARGPEYGLLGGYYAPTWLLGRSDRAHAVDVNAQGDEARIRFSQRAGGPVVLDLAVGGPRDGRVPVRARGPVTLALPASRTPVRGSLGGEPSFSTSITAGGDAEVRRPRADRVEVVTEGLGVVVVKTDCPRVHLVKAVPRGSTSVFILHAGASPPPDDPLWAPDLPAPHPDLEACARTGTTTITLPWPPPG